MKKIVFLLLCIPAIAYTQPVRLSSEARISVITCGPWQNELYSAFGHSAFRVHDPAYNIDEAYNYGVFDFDQPNFYLNFARGYLYYKLGVYDYQQFQNYYIYHNRYIHEQVLNLTTEQKQKLYDYLQWNARPENQHYRYDYFYDNCATKMRDVVVKVFGDSVKFDGSYVTTDYTIRELTDLYLVHQPWGDLGIDICLGLPMDKVAAPYEYMFLPDYVESGFDHATILNGDTAVSIVKQKVIVYESRAEDLPGGLPHPLYIFSAVTLLALVLTISNLRKKKLSTWFDSLLFGVSGAIGLLLALLWFATDHKAAAQNLNLLWAIPTHLIAVIAFIKQPKWLGPYFLLTAVITALLLAGWMVLPQKLNYSLIPVVVAIGLRAFTQYYVRASVRNYWE
jgi:hypothetical protein